MLELTKLKKQAADPLLPEEEREKATVELERRGHWIRTTEIRVLKIKESLESQKLFLKFESLKTHYHLVLYHRPDYWLSSADNFEIYGNIYFMKWKDMESYYLNLKEWMLPELALNKNILKEWVDLSIHSLLE